MTGSRAEDKGTASQLVGALRSDQFILYCQPIKPIAAGEGLAGYQEILIRFLEEEEKLLPPGSFFPILESCKLMGVLDQWVIKQVIRWIDTSLRTRRGGDTPRCSINLSSDSLSSTGFSRFVTEQMRSSDVPADKLAFEIPEPDAAMHSASLELLIEELRSLGCSFTLTGYSGDFVPAELLETLGIDMVKIDAHTMPHVGKNAGGAEKVNATLHTCRTLGIRTIAEFVEHPETLEALKALGVDYAQGYGVGKPQRLA